MYVGIELIAVSTRVHTSTGYGYGREGSSSFVTQPFRMSGPALKAHVL